MAGFIAKQPNGLYCRHSSVVDCVTHYNMTREDYINFCMERAREEAEEVLERYIKPFEWVEENFCENNMTRAEFDKILEEMKLPKEQCSCKTT